MNKMFKIVVFASICLFVIVESSNNWRLCPPCRCYGDRKADCSRNRMNITLKDVPDFLSNEIEVLNITKHNIEILRNEVFFNANLTNLWKLYLDKCSIKVMEKYAFRYLEQITDISLMYNDIVDIDSDLFSTNTNLKYLWLDNNKIKRLPDGLFSGLSNLNGVYVRFNQISTVGNTVFSVHPDLWIIDLSNNRLEYLNATIIDNLHSLKVLFLHENLWSCDCRMKILHDIMIERNLYNLTKTLCAHPEKLRGKELKLLENTDFKCWFNVITPPQNNITIFEYSNITFLNVVDALPQPEFTWNFENREISTKYITSTSNNSTVYYNNLTIVNLTPNDTGMYTLNINNEFRNVKFDIFLTILEIEEPIIDVLGDYEQFVPWDAENYTLSCLVEGVPKPGIFWALNNSRIDNNSDNFTIIYESYADYYWLNLTLNYIDKQYMGSYNCTAKNTKFSSFDNVFLSISDPVLPEVYISTGNIFKEGENATISCYIDAQSPPEFFWEFSDERITENSNNGKYKIFKEFSGNNSYWCNITIFNISYEDIGDYICHVQTKEGRANDTITIKNLLSKPRIKIFTPILQNSTALIACNVHSYPNTNTCIWSFNKTNTLFTNKFYIIDMEQISDSTFWCNLTILNVTTINLGKYYCQASNNEGSTEECIDLQFPETKLIIFDPVWYISFCSVIGCILILILVTICKLISRSNPSKNVEEISQKDLKKLKENKDFYDIPLENCAQIDHSDNCMKKEEDIMFIIERDLKSYDVTVI